MLPCARNCAGQKLFQRPVIPVDPAAAEPLLFLYPRWYRSAVRRSRAEQHVQRRSFSQNLRSRDRVALAAVDNDCEQPSLDTSSNTKVQASQEQRQNSFAPFAPQPPEKALRQAQTPSHAATRSPRPLVRQVPGTYSPEQDDGQLIKSLTRKSRSKNNPYSPAKIGGLELALRLFHLAPVPCASSEETVFVDASFLQWLTGTSEENIWKHWDGSGCVIHARPRSGDDSPTREVLLCGTQRAREIAGMYLEHSEALYKADTSTQSLSNLLETSKNPSPSAAVVHSEVGQLPKPKSWNLKSFCKYVETITSARKLRGIERILYPGGDTYNKAVANLLIDVFSDHALRPFWSSVALQRALEFLCNRTEISFAATRIWAEFRQAGMLPSTASYNLEIKRRLRVRNLAGIVHLLDDMETTHIRPDATTWAVFFKFLRSRTQQNMFLALLSKGDVKPDNASRDLIVQSLLETEFELNDDKKNCVAIIQKRMQGTFGDDWLTTNVVRVLVEKCTRSGAFGTISKVLELAGETDVLLDNATILAVSRAVSRTSYFEETLLLLQSQRSNPDVLFRQRQIEVAFKQAWNNRHVNSCRVLWHYAASHGMVKPSLMRRISQNLASNVHPATGQQPSFESRMAKLIVDTSASAELMSAVPELFSASGSDFAILEALSQWVPSGAERHQQMQLVHLLIERDVSQWQRVKPIEYGKFLDLIQEAFDLDIAWQKRGYRSNSPLHELMQQTIKIQLEPRTLQVRDTAQSTAATELVETGVTQPKTRNDKAQPTRLDNPKSAKQPPARDIDHPSGAGTLRNLFHTCPTYPPMTSFSPTTTAIAPTTPCTSIPLIDFLLQHLGLTCENG